MPIKLYETIQRLIDLGVALAFVIVFSWMYVLVGFLIWINDRHSPIYHHTRIGKTHKPFELYKFRSMVTNADDILFRDKNLLQQVRTGKNKIVDDPRVTRIGKFIRKYSIDEMPQVFNVLKGDMSLVGPRALRPDEFGGYESRADQNRDKMKIITSVKPGMTGLWQVSGRSSIDFDERINLECEYASQKSILKNLVIIAKTPLAVLRGEGAY